MSHIFFYLVIAENAKDAIPYFSNGLKVVARSMPTSAACDHLKKTLGTELYEGWFYNYDFPALISYSYFPSYCYCHSHSHFHPSYLL